MSIMEIFNCFHCRFSAKFDYFGKVPPFCKSITIMEDAYVIKDPFADDQKCIILGSKCVSCQQPVCVSQDCSLFYSKRFCIRCVRDDLDQFPVEIQAEVLKKKLAD